MSWDTYALHAYAVDVEGLPLRAEIKALLNSEDEEEYEYKKYQTVDDVLESYREGDLNNAVADRLDGANWEILFGPVNCMYIGYSAIMPYEKSSTTKEDMDKEIYDTLAYLCGEERAKESTPSEVFETWTE